MRTYYAIGLINKIFGDDAQCEGYLKEVYRKCMKHLPENDKKTASVKSMLLEMNVNLDEIGESRHKGRLQDDSQGGDQDN